MRWMFFLLAMTPSFAIAELVTFEDLPTPPPVNGAGDLFFANNQSSNYAGIAWGDHFSVFGSHYGLNSAGPLFGNVHGDYGLTNSSADPVNGLDSVSFSTNMVLTGSFWGRNEYFGFAGGADQITIHVMSGSSEIASASFNLPDWVGNPQGGHQQPGPLGFFDTSSFASLSGITGYVISRHESQPNNGNWVADDFTFLAPSTVPEPSTLGLIAFGAIGVAGTWLSRRRKKSVAAA
jgi:hypothetical protein